MAIWALGDLHLAINIVEKSMEEFGEPWLGYVKNMENHWTDNIQAEDLVLIPGDISWATRLEDAKVDLDWIGRLPGTKLILRGNHDYWWTSLSKIGKIMPPSMHVIQNNAFHWKGVGIGGTRLWDIPGISFKEFIDLRDNPKSKRVPGTETDPEETRRLYERELGRLELSLKCFKPEDKTRIAMLHYPPLGADMQPTEVTQMLEKYKVNICIFGHLHNLKKGVDLFGELNGIKYILTASDYLNFKPLKILE